MSFRLQVESGKGAGKTFSFPGGRVRIGRQPDNELVLYEAGVSRHHCEIYSHGSGYRIRDVGSANGTFVDGASVGDAPLKGGRGVRLGPIELRFLEGGESAGAPQGSLQGRRREASAPRSRLILRLSLGGLILCGGGLAHRLLNPPMQDRSNEFFEADVGRSYGYGRVAVNTPDRVRFRFLSLRGEVYVRYAAGSVDGEEEVKILVNGEPLGFVPASVGKWTPHLKFRIPREALVEGPNVLCFDNVLTPKQVKRWGIAAVRIEETPLPKPDLQEATRLFELGKATYQTRSVAPENLHRSIKYLQESRRYVEGEDWPDPLLKKVERLRGLAEGDLLELYRTQLFGVEKAFRFGDRGLAALRLRSLLRHFPDPGDARHQMIKKKLEGLAGGDESH